MKTFGLVVIYILLASCSSRQASLTSQSDPLNFVDLPVDKLIACAQEGNATCQFELALVYFDSEKTTENTTEAFKWLQLSADNGLPAAQNEIGYLYEGECDCKDDCRYPQDFGKALKWFRLAAAQGDRLAQYNIGRFYSLGMGVDQNPETAFKWFRMSAENGYNCAQYSLGQLLFSGQGAERNQSEALQWVLISEAVSVQIYNNRYSRNIDIQRNHPLEENQLYKDIVALSKTIKSELSGNDIFLSEKYAHEWLKKHPYSPTD